MKQLDDFSDRLMILKNADFRLADYDAIFIPAFVALEKTLMEKLAEAESDWT